MAAAITIIPIPSCAAATGSSRSTSMSRAVRRPPRPCSTESCSCSGRSAAPARTSGEGMNNSAPRIPARENIIEALSGALGEMLIEAKDEVGEVSLTVRRESIGEACTILRDRFEFQQLMEIAGVDYPQRSAYL